PGEVFLGEAKREIKNDLRLLIRKEGLVVSSGWEKASVRHRTYTSYGTYRTHEASHKREPQPASLQRRHILNNIPQFARREQVGEVGEHAARGGVALFDVGFFVGLGGGFAGDLDDHVGVVFL